MVTEIASWGIAGCGWVARDYVGPAIQASRNGRLAALFDPAPASLQQAAGLFQAPAHSNLESFLNTPGLDAVYVAAPNHAHRALVEAAAAAGLPVLCEKPMATTMADADAMVAACNRAGVLYATAFDQRFHAAHRSLAAHDEGERPDAVAMRLAGALDARPNELAAVLVESIGDRRLSLFVAVLAHALGIAFDQARSITLEPEGDRLWLALRAIDMDRPTIARIGLALSEADPRRDIEAFADALDAIVSVGVEDARASIAPLELHSDFRMALRALSRTDRR